MNVGKSIVSHFFSKVVASGAGFVATFVIARVLGASTLGTYALAQSLIIWAVVPALGISKAAEKYISEGERPGAHLTTGAAFSLLSVAVVAVLLLLFDGYVSQYVGADVTLLVVLIVAATVSFDTVGAFMKGEKLVAQFGWLTTGEKILRTLFQLLFIWLGYTIAGLLAGHAFALLVVSLAAVTFLETQPSLPTRTDVKKFLDFARYSWMGGLKTKTFGWMDTLVLGFFVSSSLVGIYEVAWTLSAFLVLASNSIRNVMFPEFSEMSGRKEHGRISDALATSIQYTGVLIIPGFFGAVVVGPRLLKIYRPEFVAGSMILLVLILAQIFEVYGSQFVDLLDALNRPDSAFRTNVAFTVANLALNVVLISQFGWLGAAVATFLSSLLTLGLGYYYLTESLETIELPVTEIGKQVVSAAVMAVAIYGLEQAAPPNHYATLFLVFLGAVLYGVSLLTISTDTRQTVVSVYREFSSPQ